MNEFHVSEPYASKLSEFLEISGVNIHEFMYEAIEHWMNKHSGRYAVYVTPENYFKAKETVFKLETTD